MPSFKLLIFIYFALLAQLLLYQGRNRAFLDWFLESYAWIASTVKMVKINFDTVIGRNGVCDR